MNRIIIVGKGASGKDYLKKTFIDCGFSYSISYTTRPKRDDEIDGVNYHFITEEEFARKALKCEFIETDNFNGWYYGTHISEWNNKQIFILTPNGLSKIPDKKNCFIIYLDIDKATRYLRMIKRSDSDSVQRRIEADENDFKDFNDYDIIIKDSNF